MLVFFLLFFISLDAFTCDIDGVTGVMPENSRMIFADSSIGNSMTQDSFDRIIDDIFALYIQEARDLGKRLRVERVWSSGKVNAYASQRKNDWILSLYGGLARHPEVTEDGFAAVVCHEMGHFFGGAPKKIKSLSLKWASVEGQADYFSSLKCLRRYFANSKSDISRLSSSVPPSIKSQCEVSFGFDLDRVGICMRSSLAAMSVARLYADIKKIDIEPSFDLWDDSVVGETLTSHPSPQCRLDTLVSGAVCSVDVSEPVSAENPNRGTCNRQDNYPEGTRPLCWYKPID